MPKLYQNAAANFSSFDEFKEVAVKTINEIYGREVPLDVFDFVIAGGQYKCIGYYSHEKIPAEQPVGEALSEETKQQIEIADVVETEEATAEEATAEEATAEEATAEEATAEETKNPIVEEIQKNGASDAAIKLAAQHGIDLNLVEGTGSNGVIKKSDVEDYIANHAPVTENANDGDEQSNA